MSLLPTLLRRRRDVPLAALLLEPLRALLGALMLAWLAIGTPAAASTAPGTLRIASAFDPQTMDPHALALLYHSRVVFQVYDSLVNRDAAVRARAGAGHRLADDEPDALALQAAPGVTFHDGSALHRRRRGVLDAARDGAALAARLPAQGRDGGAQGRRADGGLQLEAPDAVLPEKLVGLHRHDEPGLGREARRRARAGLQRQAGDPRRAPRQRHRAVPAGALRARRAHRAEAATRAGGAAPTRATATCRRSASSP
jgi:hypothetical protein